MCFLFGCYVESLHLQVNHSSGHFTQRKKIRKNTVKPSSSNSKARDTFNLPHIVESKVE